ncbi:MAG: translation initiation factor IF-2 [Clostridiales bacterium]|nr:translation initiation factor IF-2 [Clostridiales bacterium]
MSLEIKYRVREVAKDFALNGKPVGNKKVTEILTKYAKTPTSAMAVLTDQELSIIFDYLTQTNQIGSLEEVFAETYQETSKPAAAKDSAQKPQQGQKAAQPKQGGKTAAPAQRTDRNQRQGNNKSQPQSDRRQQSAQGGKQQSAEQKQAPAQKAQPKQQQPAASQKQQPAEQKQTAQQQPASRVPQKKVVNTRKNVNVNLDRYDSRLDDLTPERAERMQQGKQKISSRRQQQQKQGKQSAKRRQEEQQQRMRRLQQEAARKAPVKVEIPDEITVGELASRMKKTGAEVVKRLMMNGIMASMSDTIDFDTAAFIAEELGCKVEKEVVVTIEEKLIDTTEDAEENLEPRAPVVVVMGHVDHGKTSLLDKIRSTNVTAGEAGGITQAIGAYQVKVPGGKIVTFLDTPGHEAFTAMRARGAMVTDIAILVVAADDGIMPQTVEAINHAKAAGIPIVVAINKMDLPGADPERIKQELTKYDLLAEDWGGDTIVCPISAKTGEGIDELLEMVLLTAEMRELRANPNRAAKGAVIEARLDKGRGPVATLLVQNGTLKQGDVIIAGTAVGRVRAMTDYRGRRLKTAGPSVPVEITGMAEVPSAGDDFYAVADERMARELAEQRKQEQKAAAAAPTAKKVSLDDLFSQIQEGEVKDLNIIVKADVQGSVEAVKQNLEKLSNDEVRVRVIHGGVGAINESDIMLASTSNAIIVGFNVRPDPAAKAMAERNKVDMRMYRVIYECIEEIEAAMKGMLAPTFKEVELGRVEVRQVYKITNVGIVAGSYVLEGKVTRNAQLRLVRDGIVIHEGNIASLQRFKDSVREVQAGYECGITLEKFSDIKVGDIFECFQMEEVEK